MKCQWGLLFVGVAIAQAASLERNVGSGRAAQVHLPKISTVATNASQAIDRRLASFSFELSFLPTFAGNKSHPNVLTRELMKRLEERTGVGPDVRPGGISVDSSVFDPHAPALVLDESPTGGIYKSTFGPAFFDFLDVFPKSTRVLWSVNLGNNTIGFAQAGIKAAIKYIGWDRLFAFELGNEADHYAGGSRPSGWSSADYTAQFIGWTSFLTRNLSLPHHIFLAGGFAEDPTSAAPMTTVSIIKDGVDTTGVIKLFAQHTYQYSTCDPARNAIATLAHLVNHRNITAYLDLWKPQIAAAHKAGKEFIVASDLEYSSVSCSGKQNVTDTFGQALWLADTILYGGTINIARMHLHQGATLVFQSSQQANSPGFSWYDLWYPVESDRYGAARASPSFVAYLLVTEAVGRSGLARFSLIDVPEHPDLAVYAIWDPAVRKTGIARLAVLNVAVRNETTSGEDAAGMAVTLDLSPYVQKGKQATAKRMQAPGLDSKDSTRVTWAGQSYANGTAAGEEVVEKLKDGKITVEGSEGVLVFFA
ncbi:Glycoside Hydrolase Family 79 protein [Trametes cinnabarina]|uniref:Glycoside Hydrolase Family 79 protein n=1 Tax=Pycnoporus cinnabarinus TaxID=5643 RepID=A0A060SRX2_PYCCI|nr:Glycoside Hydrolase Family 79 protein [Trametes cinnabarina]